MKCAEPSSLVDVLRQRASHDPEAPVFTFLGDGENESGSLTFRELDDEARALAALLQEKRLAGNRALILLPSGLEPVSAFFGCFYAGVVAVATAVPSRPGKRHLERLLSIVRDARPRAVITAASLKTAFRPRMADHPDFADILWIIPDDVDPERVREWQDPGLSRESLAFLQYTSGSTAAPRGVMVSHGNLVHNSETIRQAFRFFQEGKTIVSWLPLHHDMGLVGMVFQPVYSGLHSILMPPLFFLQRPVRWLQAISRYRADVSGAPNFAYEMCVRKITAEQCEGLDLSCWRLAYNGAEPIRASTLERFAQKFHPWGVRMESLYPCYGLAEATLLVAGCGWDAPPVIRTFDGRALQDNRAVPAPESDGSRKLVSSGRPCSGQRVVIVDPRTRQRCLPGRIGEVWITGKNVGQGYWQLPRESEQTFGARLAEEPQAGRFLRTGDLGFLDDGELFITGREKDLIIIVGQNHYPQDIEQTVEMSQPNVRPGCSAAIPVDVDEEERLVVVAELRRGKELAETARSIRRLVAEVHDLRVHAVELVKPGTIPKTTSGKTRRRACRAAFLAGELARWEPRSASSGC